MAVGQRFTIADVTLAGARAKLMPLAMDWRDQLIEAASVDRAIFRWRVAPMDRVEFKAHASNLQSPSALPRLGAVEEGALRNHVVTQDGSPRHSVCFSVIDSEWPGLKSQLESRLHGDGLSNA